MKIPILAQESFLIASIQEELSDDALVALRDDLADMIGATRATGIIIDVSAIDVLDSFASRMLRDIAYAARLRGARAIVVGIQPEVAYTMVMLGLRLTEVETLLDLEEALAVLRHG
jgi:rsbT antagonist protein RsbS